MCKTEVNGLKQHGVVSKRLYIIKGNLKKQRPEITELIMKRIPKSKRLIQSGYYVTNSVTGNS